MKVLKMPRVRVFLVEYLVESQGWYKRCVRAIDFVDLLAQLRADKGTSYNILGEI